MLSHIVHDWDEGRCVRVLGNCRRAMRGGGRLLLVEMVIPRGNDFHPGKFLDLVMLAVTGGGSVPRESTPPCLRKPGLS
jgi:hypothetical protein